VVPLQKPRRRQKNMFRIRVDDQSQSTTLYIEGNLVGGSVNELRRVWTDLHGQSPNKQTVIELTSVRAVDHAGYKVLRQMHEWGTRLTGSGLVIASLIEEITEAVKEI